MNGLRLSSSIKRWAAAGNNSAAGPTRATALPSAILGHLIEAQEMALLLALWIQQPCQHRRPFWVRSPMRLHQLECVDHAEVSRSTGSPVKKVAHREQLHSDFISERARAMVDAMQHKFEYRSKLTPVYGLEKWVIAV